jgi:hypothetical protein
MKLLPQPTELSDKVIPKDVQEGLDSLTYAQRYSLMFERFKNIEQESSYAEMKPEIIEVAKDLEVLSDATIDNYISKHEKLLNNIELRDTNKFYLNLNFLPKAAVYLGGGLSAGLLIGTLGWTSIPFVLGGYYYSDKLFGELIDKIEGKAKEKAKPSAEEISNSRLEYINSVRQVLDEYHQNPLNTIPMKTPTVREFEPKYQGKLSLKIMDFYSWINNLEKIKELSHDLVPDNYYKALLSIEYK